VFDKTGTLTEGTPKVVDVAIAAGAVWALHRLCGSRLAAPVRRNAG